jgi:hypothetical protein
MNVAALDLTGERFERWTVLRREGIKRGGPAWLCRCACGAERVVCGNYLRHGTSRSCGCLQREEVTARSLRHGHHRKGKCSPEYFSWRSMVQRSTNPNTTSWEDYGGAGKGIDDPRWFDFKTFYSDNHRAQRWSAWTARRDIPSRIAFGRTQKRKAETGGRLGSVANAAEPSLRRLK